MNQDRSIWEAFIGDGGNLILLTGLVLCACGAFALFQSATGHFLPHDVAYLGMDAAQLCSMHQCKIVHFMIHDRVSFGGALLAIGIMYLWLAAFPLQAGEPWAWWTLFTSGVLGFGSFLTYLGYGYLDTWHGAGTLVLLPMFVAGMYLKKKSLPDAGIRCLFHAHAPSSSSRREILGRALLYFTAFGIFAAGVVIAIVGMTVVFVPEDLGFMGLDPAELRSINSRLIPLIAHDRTGFGGGLACYGVILFFCLRCATPSRSLWQSIALSGAIGFGAAIGIHPIIGYTTFTHLAPAVLGGIVFIAGAVLIYPSMFEISTAT